MQKLHNAAALFFTAALMGSAICASPSIAATPIDPAARRAWFEDARFGMFVCWGPYSILGGTWNGHTLPDQSLKHGDSGYAEWAWQRLEIPDAEYRRIAKGFNPVHFDADALVLDAKRAGMKYIVITAKFHDGFALWDSKVSDFDLAATPCKRDLLGELASACRKHDIKLGFYYSHWQDWEVSGGAKPYWMPQPDNELLPLGVPDKLPMSAILLKTGQALAVILHEGIWYVRIPKIAPDAWDTVIAVRNTL